MTTALDLDVLARVGLALADDSRRRMLVAMLDGPCYPAELADSFELTRANVSNHLACLRGCGLVVTEQEGRRVRYELAHAGLASALRQLMALTLTPHQAVCPTADDGCC